MSSSIAHSPALPCVQMMIIGHKAQDTEQAALEALEPALKLILRYKVLLGVLTAVRLVY